MSQPWGYVKAHQSYRRLGGECEKCGGYIKAHPPDGTCPDLVCDLCGTLRSGHLADMACPTKRVYVVVYCEKHDHHGLRCPQCEDNLEAIRTPADVIAENLFLDDVRTELFRARRKFPKPDGCMLALAEEVGELAKALSDEPAENVYAEAVQVAAMALRVAIEGDPTLDEYRAARAGTPHPKVR